MNLQDFINLTLTQIAKGVSDASESLKGTDAIINPRGVRPSENPNIYGHATKDDNIRVVHKIEYDIAVTVTEGTSTSGGFGVAVASIVLGSQGKSEATNSSTSRIKFSVPVALPRHDVTEGGDKESPQ